MGIRRFVAGSAWILLVTLATGGCHTMRFNISNAEEAGPVITETRMHRFWGLGTVRTVNVRTRCPHGATAIIERATAGNVMTGIFTLGLKVPRTMTFHCRAGGGA